MKVLYVGWNGQMAHDVARSFGRGMQGEDFCAVGIGGSLVGRAFDLILVEDGWEEYFEEKDSALRRAGIKSPQNVFQARLFMDHLRCRLWPCGRVVTCTLRMANCLTLTR